MFQQTVADLMHEMELNYPGVCTVLVVEKEGVASMPSVNSLLQNYLAPDEVDFFTEEIILKAGYSWKQVSNDFSFPTEFDEEEKVTVQGKHFTYKTAIKIPNDNFTRGKINRAYDGKEFIQLVKEETGIWRIVGTLERGCVYSAQLSTGSIKKGPNKFDCGFTWESGERALYTKPFLDDADWFELVFDITTLKDERIKMQESFYVDWGDGSTSFPQAITDTDNIVDKTYTGTGLKTARVYHHNKSVLVYIAGADSRNGNITSITGKLPKPTTGFYCQNNIITVLPASYLPRLIRMRVPWKS